MQNLTNFAQMLQEDYRPKVISVINNKTLLLNDIFSKLGDGEVDAEGKYLTYPVRYNHNQGVGSIGESKNLPTPGNTDTATVQINYRYTYGRFQLSAQTIKASKTKKASFRRAMTDSMKDLTESINRLRNRQLFGFGVGILARVSGSHTTGVTTITLKNSYGVSTNGTTGGNRLIMPGSYVAFVRNATPTSATDSDIIDVGLVSSRSADGTQIVLSGATAADLNDNDMVILAPAGGDLETESSVNREPMGLLGIFDDGTYVSTLHGVSRTTVTKYNTGVVNVNGPLALRHLRIASDLADERGGGAITHRIAHHSVVAEYEALLLASKRYVNSAALTPDGGIKGAGIEVDLEFDEKPFKKERLCPYGTIFGVDKSECLRAVNCEGEWSDETGEIFNRVANKDDFYAVWRIYDNFHNDRPDKGFVMRGIQSTPTVVLAD